MWLLGALSLLLLLLVCSFRLEIALSRDGGGEHAQCATWRGEEKDASQRARASNTTNFAGSPAGEETDHIFAIYTSVLPLDVFTELLRACIALSSLTPFEPCGATPTSVNNSNETTSHVADQGKPAARFVSAARSELDVLARHGGMTE